MSTKPSGSLEHFGPEWCAQRVCYIDGISDSRKDTGEDYGTIQLSAIFTSEPARKDKIHGPAFQPSTYHDYDARSHEPQRMRGEYVALCVDIDRGNHQLARVQDIVQGFVRDAAWLIYSTSSAIPGDMRWRVVVPLDHPVSFDDWHDAQTALSNLLETCDIESDRAMHRAGQIVYLPNVPDAHDKTGEALRGSDGEPLYFARATTGCNAPGLNIKSGPIAAAIAEVKRKRAEDERERERLRKEAQKRRASQTPQEGANLIADFNAANDVPTLLRLYDYKQSPRNPDDWRSPHQTSESYATRVVEDKWVSLSASDVGAGLGAQHRSGCYGDAYDLFAHYEHGGNHKVAFRALYAERRASNYTPAPPPPMQPDDPGPSPDDYPQDYGAEEALEATVEALESAPPAQMLPYFWFSDAQPNLDARDFVEDLLTTGAMSVIYGPSNCGKTFFVVDLALHVAMGREWRGKAVDKGAVVYLSLEGAQGIRNRLAAFRQHHGLTDQQLPFVAMPKPVNLLNDDADVNAVIALVLFVAEKTGMPVAMVIVDTLSRAMAGGNENSPEDMTAIVGNCDRIRDATGAHVCIVHHSGKDEARGARGHSSLRAATDTEIEIKRDPELTISSVRIAKQRDLEAVDPFAFSLHKIALGKNRRDKDVTSCVVIEAEKSVVLSRDPNKLSDKEDQALSCLARCIEAAGFEDRNATVSDDVSVVTLDHWKGALAACGVTDRNNPDVSRTQFNRIKKALVNKGKIQVAERVVWLA